MHTDGHLVPVKFTDHGVAQGLQIFAQALGGGLVEFLVRNDREGRAVQIFELRLRGLRRGRSAFGLFGSRRCNRDLLAEIAVVAALQELDQSLAAAVHDARLLENGQHVRGLRQDLLAVLQDLGDKGIEIFDAAVRQLPGLVGNALGDGQDGALLGLHDRLVGRLDRATEGIRDHGDGDLVFIAGDLAEAAQQLGQNDARIAARPAQGPGRDRLADIAHGPGILIQSLDLRNGGFDGQCHIGAGIAVRDGEDVQLIDPFLPCLQVCRTREEKVNQTPSVN